MTRYIMLVEITPRLPAGVPALAITATFPDAEVGHAYSVSPSVHGGVGPYAWTGTNLGGASVDPVTGEYTITPSRTTSLTPTITVTDSIGASTSVSPTIVVHAAIALSGTYPGGDTASSYSHSLAITGGKTPYTNARVLTGALPSGLSLSIVGSTLVLNSATPTTASTFNFTVAVDDDLGYPASSAQSVVITGPAGLGFNPADKGTHIVLSNGDFTAATSGAGGWESVRTVTSHSSGKFLLAAEMQFQTGGAGVRMFGLADAAAALSSYLGGGGGNALGWQVGTALQLAGFSGGGSFSTTLPTASNPPTNTKYEVLIAINFAVGIWLSDHTNGGWMGGGDPVAGTSPTVTFGGAAGATLFGAMSIYVTELSGQTIFTSAPWPSTVAALAATCTGYSDWG